MCLIIYCPKHTDKKKDFLKEAIKKASEFNQDGMGYATKKADNTLFLSKGYFDLDEFLNALDQEDLQEDDELLVHLRIGNIGNKDATLCHPFIVSREEEEILTITRNNVDKPILAHNGTMRKHVQAKSDFSDTYFFIKNVLSTDSVLKFLKDDPYTFDWLMQDHLNKSRLAILFPDEENSILLGDWFEIEGFYFSKDYYTEYFKPEPIISLGNRNYGYSETLFDDINYSTSDLYNIYDEKITNDFNDPNKSKIYIPDLFGRRSIKDWLGTKYIEYMGLLIPLYSTTCDYIPVIDRDNYDLFALHVIQSNPQHGIWRMLDYETIDVGNTGYTIRDITNNDVSTIPFSVFYEYFKLKSDKYTQSIYNDYFRLVSKLRLSKNLIKRLKKDLDKANNKGLDLMTVNGMRDIQIDVVEMFIINAEIELDLIKNPHKLLF